MWIIFRGDNGSWYRMNTSNGATWRLCLLQWERVSE